MKKLLPYLFIAAVLVFTQSCSKGVSTPDSSYRAADITGSWILTETADNSGSGWSYYKTGLEKGVFTFYGSGRAEYDDGFSQMTGSWDIVTLSDGYYDQYGKFYTGLHQSFRVRVDDRYTNDSINLYFDDITVTYNNIIATSYSGHTVTRYIFRRY